MDVICQIAEWGRVSQFDTQKYRGDDYQHLNKFKVFVRSTLDSKVMQTVLFNKENFCAINQPEVYFHVSESARFRWILAIPVHSLSRVVHDISEVFHFTSLPNFSAQSESTLRKSKMHKMLNTCSCRITWSNKRRNDYINVSILPFPLSCSHRRSNIFSSGSNFRKSCSKATAASLSEVYFSVQISSSGRAVDWKASTRICVWLKAAEADVWNNLRIIKWCWI